MVRATLPSGWVGHSELERDGFVVLLGRRTDTSIETISTTQVFVADVADVATGRGRDPVATDR